MPNIDGWIKVNTVDDMPHINDGTIYIVLSKAGKATLSTATCCCGQHSVLLDDDLAHRFNSIDGTGYSTFLSSVAYYKPFSLPTAVKEDILTMKPKKKSRHLDNM